MIADLKPFAEYKESGMPWLGQVPSTWRVARNGSLFGQRNETGFEELPILEVSLKTGVRVRDFENSTRKQVMSDIGKYKRAAKGDVAYNMMRMWQGAVGVSPVDGLVSPAYVVARPFPHVEPRFFVALFRTGDYMSEIDNCSRGIVKDRNRLYWDQFKQILSPCPPPAEQAAIVRFLDWANGRLERAIRAKRKVIALLGEQKRAIIRRAVTRGLDPSVSLKPSGIPWLGEIPQHWEVVRNKAVCRLGTGHTPSRGIASYWRDCSIPWVTLSDVKQFRNDQILHITKTQENVSEIGILNSAAVKLPANTVILSRTASVGFSVILGQEMATSQDFMAWTPGPRVVSTYLLFVLRAMRNELHGLMHGSTHKTIYMPTLHGLRMPLPPVDEQKRIVEALEAQTRIFDPSVQATENEIELLREYRTRLVADVVTGKLDVREAATRLPDEAPPDTAADDAALGDETEAADEEAPV